MQFIGIRSEGGLLPPDILEQIAQEKLEGQKASAFGLPAGRRLTDEIARAWSDALDYWNVFRRRSQELPEKDPFGTTLTRERWVTRLLQDLLGYDQLTYQPSAAVVNGRSFPISHRAGPGEDGPPVHIEGFKIELDKRPESRRLSPQALVQDYLNNSDEHDWGIVTNGIQFRLLRDTSRTSRPTYLEFNLQSILDGANFNEFVLFYRLCHRTRLPKPGQSSSESLLEKYYLTSVEQGGRVRDHLRDSVEEALKVLGTGFLKHPKNVDLLERAKLGKLTPQSYHRQLLRLVYRFLFLMVAEERRMIVPEEPESERRWRIYSQNYSIHRLRKLAATRVEKSEFGDLWLGLKQAFRLFEDSDANPLGIPPLNGDLFSDRAIKDLQAVQLKNDDLLLAMHKLSLFQKDKMLQWINYSGLDVEELGSVYESLLDFQPVFEPEGDGLRFNLRTGSERKSTGSYYTRPELVRELIESALIPVMEDRLAEARKRVGEDKPKQRDEQIKAILAITVCDPACGSGHFLLAAARRLGRELAKIKTGEEEPTPKEFHLAVRDVITHCIYGVDQNPLAVDLCKLALWLEGHWTGKPLSFLDHRIKCGNSLIGVVDPKALEEGVPDESFTAASGDDKEVAKAFKRRNREERKGQPSLPFDVAQHVHAYAIDYRKLTDIAEDTPTGVRQKASAYQTWRRQEDWWHDWTACNIWTAAFFVPLAKFDDATVPTHERLLRFVKHQDSQAQMAAAANALSDQLRFFHWRLEFPEVFEQGGFDVVLGNPPWDVLQAEELKFFAAVGATEIATLAGDERKKAIASLPNSNPKLAEDWRLYKRRIECGTKFVRGSGRFQLTAEGKLNTHSLFAETSRGLMRGRAGIIVPSAIATGDTTSKFFSYLVETRSLVSLKDFQEARDFFDGLESRDPFCLLTLAGKCGGETESATFVFQMLSVSELHAPERQVTLTATDYALLNPNTRNCPIFRTRTDAVLTKRVYKHVPVLINEASGENPWGIVLLRMFNMSSDSGLFFDVSAASRLRLYEAKMIHQFDHRWQTFETSDSRAVTISEKSDYRYTVLPRYWVSDSDVSSRLAAKCAWFIGVRRFARANDERTIIASALPLVGAGDSIILLQPMTSGHPVASTRCCDTKPPAIEGSA